MKILIAGLGNPILGDDGVGWVIAQKVAQILNSSDQSITVECFSLAGISLMEQMIGFDRVILIDSFNSNQLIEGGITSFALDSLADLTWGHSASAHDLSIKNALALGRKLIPNIPDDRNVFIVAIEARHVFEFGETLTPEIEAAVPMAIQEVFKLLGAITERKLPIEGYWNPVVN